MDARRLYGGSSYGQDQRRPVSARGERPVEPEYYHAGYRHNGGAAPGGGDYQHLAADKRASQTPYAPDRLDPSSFRAYAQQNYTTAQFNGGTEEYRGEARTSSRAADRDLYGSGRLVSGYHDSKDVPAPLTPKANGRSGIFGSERSRSTHSTEVAPSSGDVSSAAPSSLRSSYQDIGSVHQSSWQAGSASYANHPERQRETRNAEAMGEERVAAAGVRGSSGTGEGDEIVKLRALLASSNSELSRQISTITTGSRSGAANEDKYQLHLAQKQVVNLEAKLHLSESQGKTSNAEAAAAAGRAAELEAKFKALQTEHARVLGRQAEKEKLKEAESFGINQSVELIKSKRDAEALRVQYDELSHRHSVLQRSLQLLDEQKSIEMKTLTDVSIKLSDAERDVQMLQNKESVLLQENEMLKQKVQHELEIKEEHRVKTEAEHEAALARAHTVILAQKSELEAARESEQSLQVKKKDFEDSIKSLTAINQEISNKEEWLLTRLHAQGAREVRCNVMLDRSWSKAVAAMRMKPIISEWRDAVSDELSRRGVLHCLLSGIMGGWNRRFRKNHFLAWKFYSNTIARGCDTKMALLRGQTLAAAFAYWAEVPHASAQVTSRVDVGGNVQRITTNFHSTTPQETHELEIRDKLASLAEQLRMSQKGLYEAEQHKSALQSEAQLQMEAAIKERDLSIGDVLADKQRALAAAEAESGEVLRILRADKETAEEALKECKAALAAVESSTVILQSKAQAAQQILRGQVDEAVGKVQVLEEELKKTVEAGNVAAEVHQKTVVEQRALHEAEIRQLSSSRQQQIDSLNGILKEHEDGRKNAWAERQALSQKVEDLRKELTRNEEQVAKERGQDKEKVQQLLDEIKGLHAAEIDFKFQAAQQADAQARLVAELNLARASDGVKAQELAALQGKLAKLEERRQDENAELEREARELKDALMQQSGDLQADVSSLRLREKELQTALDMARADMDERISTFKAVEADLRKQLSEGKDALSSARVEMGKQVEVLEEQAVERLKQLEEVHAREMADATDAHKRFEVQMKETLAQREDQASSRLDDMKKAHELRERDWQRLKDDMQMSNADGAEELKLEYQRRMAEKDQEHERALDQLQRASRQAEQAKMMTDADIDRLQGELATKQTALFKSESEANKLASDVAKLNSEVERLKALRTSLSEELEAAKQEAKDLRSQTTYLKTNVDRLEHEIKEQALMKLADQDQSVKQEMETLRRQRDQLTKRLNDTTALLQESQTLQQTLVDQMTRASGDADVIKDEHHRLQGQLEKKDRDIADLKGDKKKLRTELELAERRNADLAESAQLFEGRLATSESDAKLLRASQQETEEANVRLTAELKDANMLMTQYSNQTADSTSSIKQMQERLLEAELALQKQKEQSQQQELEHSSRKLAVKDLEDQIALKTSSIEALEFSLRSATQKADSAQEEAAGLKKTIREMQAQLDQTLGLHNDVQSLQATLRQQMASVEKENATLTEEMDKILQENATLRQELDDTQVQLDDVTSQNQDLQDQNNQLALRPQLLGHSQMSQQHTAQTRPPSSGSSRDFQNYTYATFSGVSDYRRTCGVHTLRLLRRAFNEWMTACEDRRMTGLKPAFSCLDQLTNQDGSIAAAWAVARIRRENLDINKERIGSGSFAEVFKGELKIKCAVKKIRVVPLPQAQIHDFVREGEMMRCAVHPHIAKLLGVMVDQGSYSLVQEYIQGTNLFDFMHKFNMKIPLPKQILVAVQVCDAMNYLHSIRIVHRDLKSQNVIYQEAAAVCKLCDFGLARLMPPGYAELDPAQLGTGGTPAYQGPEVLKRHPIGFRVDLYGFGVMIWEMYTSKLPWSDCTLEQMTHKVAIANERPPGMPPAFAHVREYCC